ncbi:Protein outspread [Temnothorax longispinosus]|uniref:Protein outspread n=1 Tax=Temnothorax longispinosus TaxID=300112 RepID=A0A4S2K877_9HYME|nr:Protein outspread [Temnothorax longispinosus]
MSGGTAGGGGVRGTGAECRKFAPNIFNKSKCSSCFKQKEEHSAEALECNRIKFVRARVHSVRRYTAVYPWVLAPRGRCEISECRQPCDLFSVHSSHLFLQHPYEREEGPLRELLACRLSHGCGISVSSHQFPLAILSRGGDTRCATYRKSIRRDKNLILFVIHLFDEAYKRTSRVQDRALRRPLERREAGMMDGGAVNKMKRPESCLPFFGRHPPRDQRDILSSLSRRRRHHHNHHHHYQLFILSQRSRPRADHLVQLASRSRQGHPLRDRLNTSRLLYEILLTDLREGPSRGARRGLPRIIACLCLARLDNSSHQVGVAATVCKRRVCEYRFISRSSSTAVRCAEDDYLQSSRHNILPDLVLSMVRFVPPLSLAPSSRYVVTTIYHHDILRMHLKCLYTLYST